MYRPCTSVKLARNSSPQFNRNLPARRFSFKFGFSRVIFILLIFNNKGDPLLHTTLYRCLVLMLLLTGFCIEQILDQNMLVSWRTTLEMILMYSYPDFPITYSKKTVFPVFDKQLYQITSNVVLLKILPSFLLWTNLLDIHLDSCNVLIIVRLYNGFCSVSSASV